MQQLAASRPLVIAGAAAIGASLIALTPTVANDLAADAQRSTVIIQHHAIELADTVANPIQTWVDTFSTLGINLQALWAQFQAVPFALSQQLAANFLQYGVDYVSAFQNAAIAADAQFLNTGSSAYFVPGLELAGTELMSGQIAKGVTQLYNTVWNLPITNIGYKLFPLLNLPGYILQNATNFSNSMAETGVPAFVLQTVFGIPGNFSTALGNGLQAVYDSFTAGDQLGAVINAIDIPGEIANLVLNGTYNGFDGYSEGIFSAAPGGTNGLVQLLTSGGPQIFAADMVAPNAQNIVQGGSIATAFGNFVNTLNFWNPATTSWPTVQSLFDGILGVFRYVLEDIGGAPAAAANGSGFAALAPAASSAMAGLSGGLPGLSAGVLKAFDPAAVTNIAGSLGPSLAAEVAGSLGANLAGSLATTLSVDLSKVALHILSAL
ncbi:hypothetical protein H7H82_12955 [Mycobacterium heidelbergense]|uniref:Uncharacterized protein n=1 Tax=Mycobacterium heidelbergense TaxID=53376 RepID=A0A1X0DS46_MYCHE|nr:hypothetical protein [Mycobacterium heidelbergense]MCV7051495.1 hypothetical protein [Mycobacterium heidelbergense]ORA75201.1 hypothetical protein BST25_06880 [Mycobacterium heidelbergense]BBZ49268.1 hypothetical protein MHEI_09850 [Mycobacterium heidelbergense]